jgi:hypothetical protein
MSKSANPVSAKQLAANRANAAKSTGPRTPEGKARASQNARCHGFTAATFAVVRLEELDEIARLRADLISVYQPVNSQELFALERMAIAQQTILRAARLESGLFTTCLNEAMGALDPDGDPYLLRQDQVTQDMAVTRAQNRNFMLAEGFHKLCAKSNSWQLFLRYQAQAERNYRRALEEFERLTTLRAVLNDELREELPNQPICEPTEPANPPAPEPITSVAVPPTPELATDHWPLATAPAERPLSSADPEAYNIHPGSQSQDRPPEPATR